MLDSKKFDQNKRVALMRASMGLSLRQFEALTGVDNRRLSDIEHEVIGLSKKNAKKIADGLNIGIEWLLDGDESKRDNPVNDKMIEWLWEHEEIRIQIWKELNEK